MPCGAGGREMKVLSTREKLKIVTGLEWDKIPKYGEKIFLALAEKGLRIRPDITGGIDIINLDEQLDKKLPWIVVEESICISN